MESSLFIAVKAPTPQHAKHLCWMLGDNAPIFEEEVPKKWRNMFVNTEELCPEEFFRLSEDIVLFNWLCGYWDEAFEEHSKNLTAAGFTELVAYYLEDENEGYIKVSDQGVEHIKPSSLTPYKIDSLKLPKWSQADLNILKKMISCLEK